MEANLLTVHVTLLSLILASSLLPIGVLCWQSMRSRSLMRSAWRRTLIAIAKGIFDFTLVILVVLVKTEVLDSSESPLSNGYLTS